MKRVLAKVYGIKPISCPAGAEVRQRPVRTEQVFKGKIKIGRQKVQKPYLLITNRHFSQKRFEYGISAFSHLVDKYPQFSLVITGKPTEYTDELKALVHRLGLTDRVNFVGFVREKQLTMLYSQASVYLYTAPEEDFGMGIIEAMGQGVPVIAWNNAGPAYTVINRQTGYLAKPFVVADFAGKLKLLLADSKKRRKMATNACRHVQKNFTLQQHQAILEEALLKVAKNGEEK